MEAISSADCQNQPAKSLDDMLQDSGTEKDTLKNYAGIRQPTEQKDVF
jgi:hypothetical protein